MSRADKTPTIEAAVLICPVTPTDCPKESPISIRSKPTRNPGGIVAKREITMEGRTMCPGFSYVFLSVLLIFFIDSGFSLKLSEEYAYWRAIDSPYFIYNTITVKL
jgi:hypothetical protein